MAMVTIRLPQELRDRIDRRSDRSGRTKSYFIRQLVERGVRDLEEEIREIEAVRAAIREGRRDFKTYSLDEVLEHVGLTRMDIGMEPDGRQSVAKSRKASNAKNPKEVSVAKAKPESKKTSKGTRE
jgi:RHH-type rel operon transcriptional repressor/antitoxin RelB